MTNKELKEILTKHKKWLENKSEGRRANLLIADLRWSVGVSVDDETAKKENGK